MDANEKLLDRLRSDMYEDFMLMDTEKALSGNMTATAIRLAYQAQDDKCGDFEYRIREFIGQLLDLLGTKDEPSFQWNRIANQMEETQMVMMAATELDSQAILDRMAADDLGRFDGEDFGAESGGLISAIKKAIGIPAKAIGLKIFQSESRNDPNSENGDEENEDN